VYLVISFSFPPKHYSLSVFSSDDGWGDPAGSIVKNFDLPMRKYLDMGVFSFFF